MSLRRIFLLSAAGLVSFAALIAIGAVLNGDFGETEVRILGRLATTFVAGADVLAVRGGSRASVQIGETVAQPAPASASSCARTPERPHEGRR